MFKLLVLLGFVAAALAVPLSDDASPVAVRQARASEQECRNKCRIYSFDSYFYCVIDCMSGKSMKTNEVEDFSINPAPSVAVRKARSSQQECHNQCSVHLMHAGWYWICMQKCMSGRGTKTGEEQDFSTPAFYPSAQPINPGMLMQFTEPISSILSQVIKRQQEMLQMIESCKCAKPTVPVTPFGTSDSDMGPYF